VTMSKINIQQLRLQPYESLIQIVNFAVGELKCPLSMPDFDKLRHILHGLWVHGSVVNFELHTTQLKVAIFHDGEYVEKTIGNSPWVVRTPFRVIATLETTGGIERCQNT